MTPHELVAVLEKHERWLKNKSGGSRANLTMANMEGSNLSGVNLAQGKLSGANLSHCDLSNANLSTADLFAAHLGRLATAARERNRPLSVCVLKVADRPNLVPLRKAGWIDRASGTASCRRVKQTLSDNLQPALSTVKMRTILIYKESRFAVLSVASPFTAQPLRVGAPSSAT